MNAERAKRREKIAAQMMAGLLACPDVRATEAVIAEHAIKCAEVLMANLDEAALADVPDVGPAPVETHDRGDKWLNAITEAQCETLRRSVDAFFDNVAQARKEHREYTWGQFQDELSELRKVAKRDRDSLGDKYIEISALNGIVKVREDRVAELERKLDALKEFVERVRVDAEHNPELYAPFVALLRDLEAAEVSA